MEQAGVPDADLVRQTLEGDREAFGTLVQRYLRPGLAAAWEFVERREDAEDLLQEAFLRTLGRLDRFDCSRPFAPWFFTIVRNLGRNERAARTRRATTEYREELSGGAFEDPAELDETRHHLGAAIATLSPKQRACYRLKELEGFSAAEVGDILGLSASTVRVHLHRARAGLRERLGVLRDGAATS